MLKLVSALVTHASVIALSDDIQDLSQEGGKLEGILKKPVGHLSPKMQQALERA